MDDASKNIHKYIFKHIEAYISPDEIAAAKYGWGEGQDLRDLYKNKWPEE
nr:hypothetical protein [uncultured Desulfobacter sp.]